MSSLETVKDCSHPWTWMMVASDGVVKPCCWAPGVLGNLNQNTPEAIWNGPIAQELRGHILQNRIHPICSASPCKFVQNMVKIESIPVNLSKSAEGYMNPEVRKTLFVTGIPSGTYQDIQELLCADPRIILELERFSDLDNSKLGPNLFEKKSFVSHEASSIHTNSEDFSDLDPLSLRFDQAVYVGDNLPNLFKPYSVFKSNFSEAKVFFVLRNITDIFRSYKAYKKNTGKNQGTLEVDLLNVKHIVQHWNQLLVFLENRIQDLHSRLVVYENLASDIKVYTDLYNFLELELPNNYEEIYWNHTQKLNAAQERLEKMDTLLTPQENEYILENSYWPLYQSILENNSNSTGATFPHRSKTTLSSPMEYTPLKATITFRQRPCKWVHIC